VLLLSILFRLSSVNGTTVKPVTEEYPKTKVSYTCYLGSTIFSESEKNYYYILFNGVVRQQEDLTVNQVL